MENWRSLLSVQFSIIMDSKICQTLLGPNVNEEISKQLYQYIEFCTVILCK